MHIHRLERSSPDGTLLPAAAVLAAAEGERRGLASAPPEVALARLRVVGPTGERWLLVAGEVDDPSGVAVVDVDNGPVNAHVAQVTLAVPPDRRRRGVGRALIEQVSDEVRSGGRSLLITTSESFVPAGAAFAAAVGFEPGLVMRVNRLELAGVDWDVVDSWIAAADPAYELVRVDGPLSDELVGPYIDAALAMNDAPTDDLDVEDEQLTVEHVRAREARFAATRARSMLLLARPRDSGAGAGFTDVRWWPFTPHVLFQGGTATHRDHRGHGLGRWMKAAMLRWACEELPGISEVRTENAHTNPYMLAINDALGFVHYAEETIHQRRLG